MSAASFHQGQPDEGGDVPPADTDMLLRLCGFDDAADEIVRLRVQVVRLKVEIEDLRSELEHQHSTPENDTLTGVPQPWHVISSRELLALLRRSHAGEDPEMLYLESYVNADRDGEEES